MKLFDKYVKEAAALLQPYLNEYGQAVEADGACWPLASRNAFIMERDTAVELGGYPKESVNLILSSSAGLSKQRVFTQILDFAHAMRDETGQSACMDWAETHQSFGKIIFLQTEELTDDKVYDFQQAVQLADLRLYLEHVMSRTSSRQYQMNLRIGRKAAEAGLGLDAMARTMRQHFLQIPGVKDAAVILLAGDSLLYKQLLPIAEKVKEVTAALNTMFEGIDMDCGSCSLNEICDEVEGLREMHRNRRK